MIKLTVLYGAPASPEAFEDHYARVHVPLAQTLPGLARLETARVVPGPDGSAAPYYRIAELWFPDQATFGAAMASEQGRATAADISRFASGGATTLICHVDGG